MLHKIEKLRQIVSEQRLNITCSSSFLGSVSKRQGPFYFPALVYLSTNSIPIPTRRAQFITDLYEIGILQCHAIPKTGTITGTEAFKNSAFVEFGVKLQH